jgi:hypothetical protein
MTRKRIEFAPDDRLSAVEHLAPRFFAEVVGIPYEDCLITDYSQLGHFADNADGKGEARLYRMFDRIVEHYRIDVRPLDTDRIVTLLEYLASQGVVD